MNQNPTPPFDDEYAARVGARLTQRAERLTDAPLTLGDVQGRARSIRRRRTAGAAVGVAAVAAVAVPLALLAGPGTDRSTGIGPATQSPSVTASAPSASSEPSQPPVSQASDPDGTDPATTQPISYLDDGVLHRRDGTTLRITGHVEGFRPDSFAELEDGTVLAAGQNGDGDRAVLISVETTEGGVPTSTYTYDDLSGGLIANADHTIAAYVDTDGTPIAYQSGVRRPIKLPKVDGGNPTPIAILGSDCTTDPETTVDGGCAIAVSVDPADGAATGTTYLSSSHGQADVMDTPFLDVKDLTADGEFATGTLSVDGQDVCSGVYDRFTSKLVWRTCDYSTLRFSPDGSKLLGLDPYQDAFGHGNLYVLDATTHELLGKVGDVLIYDEGWVDEDHVAFVAQQRDGDWNLIIDVFDSAMTSDPTVVAGPAPAPDGDAPPFALPAG